MFHLASVELNLLNFFTTLFHRELKPSPSPPGRLLLYPLILLTCCEWTSVKSSRFHQVFYAFKHETFTLLLLLIQLFWNTFLALNSRWAEKQWHCLFKTLQLDSRVQLICKPLHFDLIHLLHSISTGNRRMILTIPPFPNITFLHHAELHKTLSPKHFCNLA